MESCRWNLSKYSGTIQFYLLVLSGSALALVNLHRIIIIIVIIFYLFIFFCILQILIGYCLELNHFVWWHWLVGVRHLHDSFVFSRCFNVLWLNNRASWCWSTAWKKLITCAACCVPMSISTPPASIGLVWSADLSSPYPIQVSLLVPDQTPSI